jgi:hypothetical protein
MTMLMVALRFSSNAPKMEKKALLYLKTPESVWCPLQLSAFSYQVAHPTLKPTVEGAIYVREKYCMRLLEL